MCMKTKENKKLQHELMLVISLFMARFGESL
jgi:hypothetical protein